MINENAIREIVTEVLKQLNFSALKPQETSKQNLLVVDEKSTLNPSHMYQLSLQWNVTIVKETELDLLLSGSPVLIHNIDQDLLVKGALGFCDSTGSVLLSQLISNAVPVHLIPTKSLENTLFGDISPSAYQSMLRNHCHTLESFGVNVATLSDFLKLKVESEMTGINFEEKLLTAHNVQVHPEENILVSSKTIITPLAKDTARDLGKKITVINDVKGAST
ncbi:hypothetical protein [Bacillus sp. JJ722]|uniref:hypothetical protein n=1 Tax=Bacillus sp. JJ722 TaxID=3122973 RepID=UPI003000B7C0